MRRMPIAVLTALIVTGSWLALAAAKDTPSPLEKLAAQTSPLHKGEAIAFFGDSITQQGAAPTGYVTLFEKALTEKRPELEVKIIKAGISGNKVPDLQGRLERDVLAKKPTVVFIYIGINDVWHSERGKGTPADKYEAGLGDLVDKMHAAGVTVVLATPSVIGEKAAGTNKLDKMLDEYAEISRKVAKDKHVTLCDLHQEFQSYLKQHNAENKDRGVLTTDGVHLNAAGNQFVANQAAAAILAALAHRK